MDEYKIKVSLDSGELKLNFLEFIQHFYLVFYLLLIPILLMFFSLVDLFKGVNNPLKEGEIWFYIIPPILSILFYFYQKNKLKFKIISTNLSRSELNKIIIKVGNELGWKFTENKHNVIVAERCDNIIFSIGGERITILFYKNNLYINSICDPSKRISISSGGRNRENISRLVNEIVISG